MSKDERDKPVTKKPAQLLSLVKQEFPRLGDFLTTAAENRTINLATHMGDAVNKRFPGSYLRGLAELFEYLDVVFAAFQREPLLTSIAFLISRARSDFEVAFEAILSGLNSVVLDSMRDVMEVEYLLREFSHDLSLIAVWLNSDSSARTSKFSPARLRQRQAKRLGKAPRNVLEKFEYKIHSESLHVVPPSELNDHASKGFSKAPRIEGLEFGFWEIFEHAYRLVLELHRLGGKVSGSAWTAPDPMAELPNLQDSHKRMATVIMLFAKNHRI